MKKTIIAGICGLVLAGSIILIIIHSIDYTGKSIKRHSAYGASVSYVPVKENQIIRNESRSIKHTIIKKKNGIGHGEYSVLYAHDHSFLVSFYDLNFLDNGMSGIIAGGAGLTIAKTDDGGHNWRFYRFSRFGDEFFSIARVNRNTLFVVGKNQFIFASFDNGFSWYTYDTAVLEEKGDYYPEYYKIKFKNNNMGFIAGKYKSLPAILGTTNGGKDWRLIKKFTEVKQYEFFYDLDILPDQSIVAVG